MSLLLTIAAFAAPTGFDGTDMGIDANSKFAVSGDVLFQEVSGETVLLGLNSESYFGLDEVGTRIWQLLSGGSSVGAMIEVLLEEYDVERGQLEEDVEGLLNSLVEAGLVSLEG